MVESDVEGSRVGVVEADIVLCDGVGMLDLPDRAGLTSC